MKTMLFIGTVGFIGTLLRYAISQFIQTRVFSTFPFGTLGVNLIGCLAIGLVFGISERTNLNPEWRLFLATGICGGFTTFSAFTNETFSLLRDGQIWYASVYTLASIFFGVIATFIGYSILKLI
jgi:CrcB protein